MLAMSSRPEIAEKLALSVKREPPIAKSGARLLGGVGTGRRCASSMAGARVAAGAGEGSLCGRISQLPIATDSAQHAKSATSLLIATRLAHGDEACESRRKRSRLQQNRPTWLAYGTECALPAVRKLHGSHSLPFR